MNPSLSAQSLFLTIVSSADSAVLRGAVKRPAKKPAAKPIRATTMIGSNFFHNGASVGCCVGDGGVVMVFSFGVGGKMFVLPSRLEAPLVDWALKMIFMRDMPSNSAEISQFMPLLFSILIVWRSLFCSLFGNLPCFFCNMSVMSISLM